MEDLVEFLDLPEENIYTLLSYLDDHVKVLNPAYGKCKIRCYGGIPQMKQIAKRSAVVCAALNLYREAGEELTNMLEFPVVELSARMGWKSGLVKRDLKQLAWNEKLKRKSGVLVEFSDLSFHFELVKSDLDGDQMNGLKDRLKSRATVQERRELSQLQRVFRCFSFVAQPSLKESSSRNLEKSQKLKEFIEEYFESAEDFECGDAEVQIPQLTPDAEMRIKAEVKTFVLTHTDHKWNGRAVARIFHGISSPNFPAQVWGRVRRYWRSHMDVDFYALCQAAKEAIVSIRGGF